MKICTKCKISKDLTAFHKSKNFSSGLYHRCKECESARLKLFRKTHKQSSKDTTNRSIAKNLAANAEKILKIKESGCIDCGEKDPLCLEFHHRDPKDKSFNICHALKSRYSWARIEKELKKCDVICRNCHRILEENDREIKRRSRTKTTADMLRMERLRVKINEYKASCGCSKCHYDDPNALDFHHVDPSNKIRTVSNMRRYKWKTLIEEISKCDVLCSNCHIKKHKIEIGATAKMGSPQNKPKTI